MEEIDDITLEEIARQVKEGYTSGILDDEDTRHVWKLKIKSFNHDD